VPPPAADFIEAAAEMTINPSGLAFPPRHGRTVVGWVERQRNPSMASDEVMGIALLNPSYALYTIPAAT